MSETEEATGLPPAPILRSEPEEIADGVFVLSDGGVPLVPNVGIVLGTRDVLVVDTGMGIRNGTKVLGHARELAAGRRAAPHGHAFPPGARARGAGLRPGGDDRLQPRAGGRAPGEGAGLHRALRELGVDGRRRAGGRSSSSSRTSPTTARPTSTSAGGRSSCARGGSRTPGATRSSSCRTERILFAGDLVETRLFPIFPYFPPDDVDVDGGRWIDVLDRLLELEPGDRRPGARRGRRREPDPRGARLHDARAESRRRGSPRQASTSMPWSSGWSPSCARATRTGAARSGSASRSAASSRRCRPDAQHAGLQFAPPGIHTAGLTIVTCQGSVSGRCGPSPLAESATTRLITDPGSRPTKRRKRCVDHPD